MSPENDCRSITQVLEDAILKEKLFHDYVEQCAEEIGNPKVKAYLLTIAREEDDHRRHLQEYLDEVKAQIEIDEAIMESYDHF